MIFLFKFDIHVLSVHVFPPSSGKRKFRKIKVEKTRPWTVVLNEDTLDVGIIEAKVITVWLAGMPTDTEEDGLSHSMWQWPDEI